MRKTTLSATKLQKLIIIHAVTLIIIYIIIDKLATDSPE